MGLKNITQIIICLHFPSLLLKKYSIKKPSINNLPKPYQSSPDSATIGLILHHKLLTQMILHVKSTQILFFNL